MSACAQNVLVNFYADNQPYQSLTNYPKCVLAVAWTTNMPGWSTNMTISDYNALMATLTPIYNAAISNADWSVRKLTLASISNLQASVSALQADLPAFQNPNYSFVTNWPNLQLGLKYINTNLLHIADVIDKLTPVLTNLYQQSLSTP